MAYRARQIHPGGSRLNQFERRRGGSFGAGTISRFDVSGYRYMNGASDAADTSQYCLSRNALAIGIAQREGDARRGGRNRGKARILEDAGAGDIPRVRQDEHPWSAMKLPELDRFIGLGFHNVSLRSFRQVFKHGACRQLFPACALRNSVEAPRRVAMYPPR